jgi:hypothetical protein
MELRSLLPISQKLTTCPYPEWNKSNPWHSIPVLYYILMLSSHLHPGLLSSLSQGKRKMRGQMYSRWIYTTIQERKLIYEHRPSEECFPSYSLLKIKKSAQSIHLEFPCSHCRRQTSGTLYQWHSIVKHKPSSHRLWLTVCASFLLFWDPTSFHQFSLGLCTTISYKHSFQNCCKMWICRLGFIYGISLQPMACSHICKLYIYYKNFTII